MCVCLKGLQLGTEGGFGFFPVVEGALGGAEGLGVCVWVGVFVKVS